MCRRTYASILLLLCVLILAVSDGGRPASGYAAVVLKPGDIITADFDAKVQVMSPATGSLSLLSNDQHFDNPFLIATGPNGEVYVQDDSYKVDDFTSSTAIARVDPVTGVPTLVVTGGFQAISGLTFDPSGRLYVVDPANQRLIRIDPSTGARTTLSTGGRLVNPRGLAIEADGSVLTTVSVSPNAPAGPREIVRIRSGTNSQEVVSTAGLLVAPEHLAVAPDGRIYAADLGGNFTPARLIEVHPQTGSQSIVAQFDANQIGSVAVGYGGIIYVVGNLAQTGEGVYRINQSGGPLTFVGHTTVALVKYTGIAVAKAASTPICPGGPRPKVSVRGTSLGNGRLQVSVHTDGDTNRILRVQFGTVPTNAVVEGQPTIAGADATFVLRRTGPGAVTLPFTVTDACGDWKTFVGGGPGAF